jgi:hypothetical protein
LEPNLAGHQQDLDRGPAAAYRVGQFQSIHAFWHVDVRKQQRNVRAGFQQGDRFIRVSDLDRHEAGFLDHFDGQHSQQRLILHDEHNRGFAGGCIHHQWSKVLGASGLWARANLAGFFSASPDHTLAIQTQCAFK